LTNTRQVQKKSAQNFNKNVDYFKVHFPDVYTKVSEFQVLLKHNKIKQRYSLEYLDGSYNLLHLEKKNYLYKKSTSHFNKKVKKTITFNTSKNTISSFDLEVFDKDYFLNHEVKEDTKTAINSSTNLINNTLTANAELKRIDKFIVIGTLLGTHLRTIDKKAQSGAYIIIEPDIEVFYNSLYVAKYYKFALKKRVSYSIMDKHEILLDKLQNFYNYDLHKNHTIKFHLSEKNYSYLFGILSVSLGRIEGLSFSYTSYLKILEKSINHLLNNENILNVKKPIAFFENQRVLIIAPGFSLSKNLSWIKKHANKFLIVCYSQCLSRLLSENIIPDIVTIVDAESKLYDDFKEIDNKILKKIILFSNVNVNKKILKLFKKNKLFFFEKEFLLKANISEYLEGFTVGETTYQIILMLGFKEIFLVGTDMAIDENTGKTHDEMHKFSSKNRVDVNKNVPLKNEKSLSQDKDILTVEGNFIKEVSTTTFYLRLIDNYNRITSKYKRDTQLVYNMSNGAKLNNTEAYSNTEKFDDFDVFDKQKLHKKLIKIFTENSENKFNNSEKQMILHEINFSKYLERKLNSYLTGIFDYQEFDNAVLKIMQDILNIPKDNNYAYIRKKIFHNYFSINANLIYYAIETNKEFNYAEQMKRLVFDLKGLLSNYRSFYERVI